MPDDGVLLNSITGQPFSWSNPQLGRSAMVADDACAEIASRWQVAAFLGRVLEGGARAPEGP